MAEEYIYKGSRSNLGYFAILYFYHCFLQLLLTPYSEVNSAVVCLRQSMRITENKAAFAFSTQESYFLIACIASLTVFLKIFLLNFFHFFTHFWYLNDFLTLNGR